MIVYRLGPVRFDPLLGAGGDWWQLGVLSSLAVSGAVAALALGPEVSILRYAKKPQQAISRLEDAIKYTPKVFDRQTQDALRRWAREVHWDLDWCR